VVVARLVTRVLIDSGCRPILGRDNDHPTDTEAVSKHAEA
jgi:hypothetical protein